MQILKIKKHSLVLIFLIALLATTQAQSDSNIGIKYIGLSIHPHGGNGNEIIMPNKLDTKAHFVINLGAIIAYEHFIYKNIITIKFLQGFYADCAVQPAGFTSIGLRARIFKYGKHSLYGGAGPTLLYRRNWFRLKGYYDSNYFKGDKNSYWQHRFIWYGGEFEYKIELTEKIDCCVSFIPGYPDLMAITAGITYNL